MAIDLLETFTYPYDNAVLLGNQKKIHRMLLEREGITYIQKKIAILGGSTTADIRNVLELFLLASGIQAEFYESEYNKFYEDAVFGNPELDRFHPDIIIIFTSVVNLSEQPLLGENISLVDEQITREISRYQLIWSNLKARYHAIILQNNFDLPWEEPLGSYGCSAPYGISHYVERLNERLVMKAQKEDGIYIHDMHGLAAQVGLKKWHNRFQYCAYKYAMDYDVIPDVANNIAKMIRALLGKGRKCLVLDLDNTLWGGIIGEVGPENLVLGHETPEGEAYLAVQRYVLSLKERGILLAVCSKNDDAVARAGFHHPDSVLHLRDFAAFRANWENKDCNVRAIAEELNIGLDSMVFLDDNPVERQMVRESLREVAVPEVDSKDVFSYIRAIEGAGYFEPVMISDEDKKRNETYHENRKRRALEESAVSYEDFLQSLHMKAEIGSFRQPYLERIAQLTNKTNQFNLTTLRCTRTDIEEMSKSDKYITLYGRLEDKFGDNGLISVMAGELKADVVSIRLWLMSCRVLKRGMENIMMDALIKHAQQAGCRKIIGYYVRTAKNKMVENLYKEFGFSCSSATKEKSEWELCIDDYQMKGKFIEVKDVDRR